MEMGELKLLKWIDCESVHVCALRSLQSYLTVSLSRLEGRATPCEDAQSDNTGNNINLKTRR